MVTVVSSSKFGTKSMSSDVSVSSSPSEAEPRGGEEALASACLLFFDFLGIIEFAHDLTLRGLLPTLRDTLLVLSMGSADSSSVMGATGDVSNDLDKDGSDRLTGKVGTGLSQRRDSKRKKPRRLVGTRGMGAVGVTGDIADIGLFF